VIGRAASTRALLDQVALPQPTDTESLRMVVVPPPDWARTLMWFHFDLARHDCPVTRSWCRRAGASSPWPRLDLGRLSLVNMGAALRLLTRRVPLLLAFVLASVLAVPAVAEPATTAGQSVVTSASASRTASPHVDHVDAGVPPVLSTTTAVSATVVGTPARQLLDGDLRYVPAQRGPPQLSA
jgi:hypothetical protein